jgi:hypothetical protein
MGKHAIGISGLRPKMLDIDDTAFGTISLHNLGKALDAVITAWTSLKILGVRRLAREFCRTARKWNKGVIIGMVKLGQGL